MQDPFSLIDDVEPIKLNSLKALETLPRMGNRIEKNKWKEWGQNAFFYVQIVAHINSCSRVYIFFFNCLRRVLCDE